MFPEEGSACEELKRASALRKPIVAIIRVMLTEMIAAAVMGEPFRGMFLSPLLQRNSDVVSINKHYL